MLLMLWAVPNPYPAAITALILGQLWAMRVMLRDPKAKAPWYNGTGVMMYVSGMLITAFALRFLGEALYRSDGYRSYVWDWCKYALERSWC